MKQVEFKYNFTKFFSSLNLMKTAKLQFSWTAKLSKRILLQGGWMRRDGRAGREDPAARLDGGRVGGPGGGRLVGPHPTRQPCPNHP